MKKLIYLLLILFISCSKDNSTKECEIEHYGTIIFENNLNYDINISFFIQSTVRDIYLIPNKIYKFEQPSGKYYSFASGNEKRTMYQVIVNDCETTNIQLK